MKMDEISLNMIANLKIAKQKYAETFLYALNVKYQSQLDTYARQFKHAQRSKRSKTLHISAHAYERWNTRVGPIVEKSTLQPLLSSILMLQPWRFRKMNENIWVLDEDILFVVDLTSEQMKIVTFLGRISLNPVLQNLRAVYSYVNNEHDRIDLQQQLEQLQLQALPILPKRIAYVEGSNSTYWLEYFEVDFDEEPVIYCSVYNSVQEKTEAYYIYLSNPQQRPLHRKVLNLLYKWGYYEFLRDYYEHFDQAKMHNIAMKMQRKVQKRLQYI